METVLRNACDACHKLKTKCPTEGTGACANCRRKGQICQFSPRSEMGRPRLTPEKAASQKQQTNKRPISEQKLSPNKRRTSSTASLTNMQRASPPRGEAQSQQLDVACSDAMGQQTTSNHAMEPLKLSDYLSTLEEACLYPVSVQSDFVMPDPSPLDLSWTQPAPPPYSSPMPITNIPDSVELMESVGLAFENSSETSSSSNPSLQPDFASIFGGAGTYAPNGLSMGMHMGVDGTQDLMNQGKDNILAEAYSQLANVLFGLHNLTSYGECGPAADLATRLSSLEKVFPLVSTLCDILKRPQLNHLLGTQKMLSSPCLLLASSVISTVVEIYSGRLSPFQPSDGDRESMAELGTQQRLQLQTDAMVMDYHLTELRPIVKMACVAMHDSQTIDLMDTMRRTLREFLEDWSTLNL